MIDLPVPARADDAPGHARLVGLSVALAVALVVLAIEHAAFRTQVTALGVLVAPYLGWCLGPDAVRFRRPARTILEMSVVAVMFGAFIVAWQMAGMGLAPDATTSLTAELSGLVGLASIGIVIFGIPALALAGVCAFAWYRIVHAITAGGRRRVRLEA